MLCDVANLNVPQYYIKCLLDNEDLDEAEKLFEFSLKIKGIDRAEFFYKSLLFERREEYKKAIQQVTEAKRFSYNRSKTDLLDDTMKFIKEKSNKRLNKKGKIKKKKAK